MSKLVDENIVAERLGCKPVTLRVWRMQGKGPQFKKIGHLVRYDLDEIDRWVSAQTRVSTSQKAPQTATA